MTKLTYENSPWPRGYKHFTVSVTLLIGNKKINCYMDTSNLAEEPDCPLYCVVENLTRNLKIVKASGLIYRIVSPQCIQVHSIVRYYSHGHSLISCL